MKQDIHKFSDSAAMDHTDQELLEALPESQRVRLQDRMRVYRLRQQTGLSGRLLLMFSLIGPGVLVMIADNDAGGVITYAQTGAQFGIGFFIPFLTVMGIVAYVVQEMTVRLGAVTGRGHAEMILGRYGHFWGLFSIIDLVLANVLTLVTEFIGIRTGCLVFGIPPVVGVLVGVVFAGGIMIVMKYRTWEDVSLWVAALNLVFVPLALYAHPDWHAVGQAYKNWRIAGGFTSAFLYVILANLGTTIAPWMLFFQQSAVVDKGLRVVDIRHGQIDTALGSIGMTIVAVALVLLTGTLVHGTPGLAAFDLDHILPVIGLKLGHVAVALFALGLMEAGLLAAVAITASTSWAVGEYFGWPRSINLPVCATRFYLPGIVSAIIAGVITLIPRAPLGYLNLTVQVVASIFMPAAMLFLLLLLNDREVMGEHVNRPWQNISAITIIVFLISMNGLYGATVVFPHLFG